MKWILLAVIVGSTVTGDLLQSREMKAHGRIDDFRPTSLADHLRQLARNWQLGVAVLCMAVSFFAFMALVQVAPLSFAVPASAATIVIETVLARLVLRERVNGLRWVGTFLVACGVALLANHG